MRLSNLEETKEEFSPHMMYDPKTGEGKYAKVEKDHLDMKEKGWGHDKPKVEEGNSPHKKGTAKYKKHMAAMHAEGYKVLPPMDDKYQERDGLEGPFTTLSGKVVYYDPKEGKYYDPDTDMYMSYDEWNAHNSDRSGMSEWVQEPHEGQKWTGQERNFIQELCLRMDGVSKTPNGLQWQGKSKTWDEGNVLSDKGKLTTVMLWAKKNIDDLYSKMGSEFQVYSDGNDEGDSGRGQSDGNQIMQNINAKIAGESLELSEFGPAERYIRTGNTITTANSRTGSVRSTMSLGGDKTATVNNHFNADGSQGQVKASGTVNGVKFKASNNITGTAPKASASARGITINASKKYKKNVSELNELDTVNKVKKAVSPEQSALIKQKMKQNAQAISSVPGGAQTVTSRTNMTKNSSTATGTPTSNKHFSKFVSKSGDRGGSSLTKTSHTTSTPAGSTTSSTKRYVRPGGSGTNTTSDGAGNVTRTNFQLKGPQTWMYDKPKTKANAIVNSSKNTKESNTISTRQNFNTSDKGGVQKSNYTSHSRDFDSKKGLSTLTTAQQQDGSTSSRFVMPGGSGIQTTTGADGAYKEKKIQMKGPQSWAYDKPKLNASKEETEYSDKQIKMAFGILNDPRYRDGNYDGAYATIEKVAKGLARHPSVRNALKRANESVRLTNEEKAELNEIWPYVLGQAATKIPPITYAGAGIAVADLATQAIEWIRSKIKSEGISEDDKEDNNDLKGFDAKTEYALKKLQAKYPHSDNLMSALMSELEKAQMQGKSNDAESSMNDNEHDSRIDAVQDKLNSVIAKNNLKENNPITGKVVANDLRQKATRVIEKAKWQANNKHK